MQDDPVGTPGQITSNTEIQDPILIFAQRYQSFFNSTNDAIAVFNPQGDIVDANPRFLHLCHCSYNEAVSLSLNDLFDEDGCVVVSQRLRLLLDGHERRMPVEAELKSRSGRTRIVEISLSLLKDQYGYEKTLSAIIRDVTRRKDMENRLMQRAEELQKVFDAVPAILAVIDEVQRIKRFNRSGLEALSLNEEDAVGRRLGDVLQCANRNTSKRGCGFGSKCRQCGLRERILRCLKAGETILNAETTILKQGIGQEPTYFRINVVPLIVRGKPWGVVSLEDITDRKRSEMESIRLHNSIARANLELKKTLEDLALSQSQLLESQKLEQIGLLSSGLAHNLRTPLSGIKGYAQLLKMDHKELRELDLIVREVDVMESIISNLMFKSRKEKDTREELLNLNDLIRNELEFLNANMFYKHRVKTTVDLDRNLPLITGVYAHYSQAIMNIVQNALDAMYEASDRCMTIKTRHDGQFIYIEISDTGCGIPEKIREKIFNVFFTTKPLSNERQGEEPAGTGLGLSSSNYYVRQYGGSIQVKSEEGKGSTFTIKIPHIQDKETHDVCRVLIVDDSDSMVDILTQMCQGLGLEVYGVTNGDRALKLFRKLKPDMVVTDLCMPGLTGPEMMSEIRKINPEQRVIYISGYSENPEFQEWLKKEVRHNSRCAVLKKPFPLDDFKRVIEKFLEK